MAQTLSIDASTLSTRFKLASFFDSYFSGFDDASQDFYGGTPDSAFGGTYYMNGSQVLSTLSSGGTDSTSVVVMEGEELAYDFIHHGAGFGHGITGALDSLIFGTWVDGETTATQGTGASGEISNLDEGLIINGFDLVAEPGAGNDTSTNLVYAVYSAIGNLEADVLYDLISEYSVEIIGTRKNDMLGGFKGDDDLVGGGGSDILRGRAGDDTLLGGNGEDSLFGGRGFDILKGGLGDDVLSGKQGLDWLTGGAGADTFLIKSDANLEVITDFVEGEDIIDVTDLGFSSLSDFDVREGDGWVQLMGDDVKVRLMGYEFADLADDMFAF